MDVAHRASAASSGVRLSDTLPTAHVVLLTTPHLAWRNAPMTVPSSSIFRTTAPRTRTKCAVWVGTGQVVGHSSLSNTAASSSRAADDWWPWGRGRVQLPACAPARHPALGLWPGTVTTTTQH